MLHQIFIHTPIFVWGILAFLVYRGVLASRDREMSTGRMLIIPAVMLALSLQSISTQFGVASVAMLAWASTAGLVTLLCRALGAGRASPGTLPGTVRLRGSWAPLALMMTIFVIKYVLAVVLALHPAMAARLFFVVPVCVLLGLCNGCFFGQLACDLAVARRPQAPALAGMS